MLVSLSLHLIGLVMWFGGMLILTRALHLATHNEVLASITSRQALLPLFRRLFFGFVVGGAVVMLGTGLYQISVQGLGFYMQQGWFHAKLTLIIVQIIITALTGAAISNLGNTEISRSGRFMAFHGISATILILIVFLTMLGRAPSV